MGHYRRVGKYRIDILLRGAQMLSESQPRLLMQDYVLHLAWLNIVPKDS